MRPTKVLSASQPVTVLVPERSNLAALSIPATRPSGAALWLGDDVGDGERAEIAVASKATVSVASQETVGATARSPQRIAVELA